MLAPLLLLWPMSSHSPSSWRARSPMRPSTARSPTHARLLAAGQESSTARRASESRGRGARPAAARRQRQLSASRCSTSTAALLAGDADIPLPRLYDFPALGTSSCATPSCSATKCGSPTRYVVARRAGEPRRPPVLVQVAETLEDRGKLANEIIKGVIVPQFIILPIARRAGLVRADSRPGAAERAAAPSASAVRTTSRRSIRAAHPRRSRRWSSRSTIC